VQNVPAIQQRTRPQASSFISHDNYTIFLPEITKLTKSQVSLFTSTEKYTHFLAKVYAVSVRQLYIKQNKVYIFK